MRQDKMTGDHFIHTKPAFIGDAPRVANTVLVDFIGATATAATHYGNPFDGACQSDEKNLTDITGGGAVCGAKCGIGHKCHTDVPAGMNAKPDCWHAVGFSTYCVNLCTTDADCGTMGKCEAVGSKTACTYSGPSGPSPGPSPGPAPGPAPGPTPGPAPAGKTHYGDPSKGCMSDEQAVQITGVKGDFCAPDCASAACPTDVPAGVTAKPQCALKAGTGTDKKCALICSPAGKTDEASLRAGDAACGTGASCKAIQSTGICTYDDGPAPGPSPGPSPGNNTFAGAIFKTSDGGKTFTTLFHNEGEYYFNGIHCASETHCLAVAEGDTGTHIFVTHDGMNFTESKMIAGKVRKEGGERESPIHSVACSVYSVVMYMLTCHPAYS